MEDSRVYFNPGDKVRIKHDLEYKPRTMLVVQVKKMRSLSGENSSLSGIECIWFDTNGAMNKEVFNTKDLEKVFDK